jgi:hypothetical protein
MGTANGFVCFHMENRGADVVAYDLSENEDWDVVPFARHDGRAYLSERKSVIRKLNNAFWLCHRAFGSNSRMVYGDVYSVPEEIGVVDVCTFGSILLHLRDPFLALQKALRLTRETVIVTDMLEDPPPSEDGPNTTVRAPRSLASSLRALTTVARMTPAYRELLAERDALRQERDALWHEREVVRSRPPAIKFLPNWRTSHPRETWWHLSPDLVCEYLGVLGFETAEVTYHTQKHVQGVRRLFTVVGHRTAGAPS